MREIDLEYATGFEGFGRDDIARVGGKNASLGEMTRILRSAGIDVPPGFAVTANAYWRFIEANGLRSEMSTALQDYLAGKASLAATGARIRAAIVRGDWPPEIAADIRRAYGLLSATLAASQPADVAVRSSATAEDLPEASFAGQQESFLHVRGEAAVLDACRRCYASLFTDRAISYRETHGFDHLKVALSVGIQQMVRSDLGSAGVMFSIDTETGFPRTVLINAAWGLGENVVQGSVDPDEYVVFKPLLAAADLSPIIEKKCGEKARKLVYADIAGRDSATTRNVPTSQAERTRLVLSDPEILTLARWACAIERHYGTPMDIEWAKDGESGKLYIVQARPETVRSRQRVNLMRSYRVSRKGAVLASGIAIGNAAVAGRVCLIRDAVDIGRFVEGSVLVTSTTDPDWVPVMKRAAALITDHGGRTSHAAIVSRELGLPAIVGAGNATEVLHDEQPVTVSCAEGDEGHVYDGAAQVEVNELDVDSIPATRTQVMLNLANPAAALRWWQLPAGGVGLARMEFVISNHIQVHPLALLKFDRLKDEDARRRIADLTRGYADKREYFVDRLARGLARIAAAQYPRPVILRTSDFKTNEYANLVGGAEFEPSEENPMLGLRGASRYYSEPYREAFALECQALKRLRGQLGFRNVIVMIPFCRTPQEADRVLEVMRDNGLVRGLDGLQVYVMCEIPSNVILAREFARRFDGFSIGSNDLTQLTLGVDRDSERLAKLFDERDPAVQWMIRRVIEEAHAAGVKVGLCGQAPSNDPKFAEFLVDCGIDSISVSPDSFVAVKRAVADAETRLRNTTDARARVGA
jgi:pyruvate, water dikinase